MGVSAALLLRLLGSDVRMIAALRADQFNYRVPPSPDFASVFPAASVIPHSTQLDRNSKSMHWSNEVFSALHGHCPDLVRRQQHYELFEEVPPAVDYLEYFSDVEVVGGAASPSPFRRQSATDVAGYRYSIFFVEYPEYINSLFRLFHELGGKIEQRDLRGTQDLLELRSDLLAICAGMGSTELIGSRERRYFEVGHLLTVPIVGAPFQQQPTSFNYTPLAEVHPGPGGRPMDVYAYPRRTSLVLGGSRLPGEVDASGNETILRYEGKFVRVPTFGQETVRVPMPIVDLNRELLMQLFGLDISKNRNLIGSVGRRYCGPEPGGGATVRTVSIEGRKMVACYGLGGSGVTLSWGLAVELVTTLLDSISVEEAKSSLIERLPILLAKAQCGRQQG